MLIINATAHYDNTSFQYILQFTNIKEKLCTPIIFVN